MQSQQLVNSWVLHGSGALATGQQPTRYKTLEEAWPWTTGPSTPPTRKDINMSSPAAPAATTDAGDGLASQHKLKSPAHTMEITQHWKTGTTSLSIHGSTTQRLHTLSTKSNINNTTESSNTNTTRSRRMDTVGSQQLIGLEIYRWLPVQLVIALPNFLNQHSTATTWKNHSEIGNTMFNNTNQTTMHKEQIKSKWQFWWIE